MRAAPAVAVELPGSRRWDLACAALAAASAGAAAAGLSAHFLSDAMMAGVCIAAAAGAGGLLGWCMRARGRGRLRWDGARWWFAGPDLQGSEEQAGSVMVMMDWGRWMLLRFDPEETGARRPACVWLPVSESRIAQAGALRAAAYGRAVSEAA
jgi:hypothetical protein